MSSGPCASVRLPRGSPRVLIGFGGGLREIAEAAILAVLAVALLRRLDHPRNLAAVLLAIGLTFAAGAALGVAGVVADVRVGQEVEDLIEGVAMIGGALLLLPVIVVIASLHRDRSPRPWLPAVVTTVVVLSAGREVPETMLEVVDAAGGSAIAPLAGFALAVIALAVAATAAILVADRMSTAGVRPVLLAVAVVGGAVLFSHGLDELASVGVLQPGPELWDLGHILPHDNGIGRLMRVFLGYSDHMTALELGGWAGYAVTGLALAGVSARARRRDQR